MADSDDSKRPEPPSPDQYERLAKDAEQLQKSGHAGKAAGKGAGAEGMSAYARFTGIGVLFALVFGLPTLLGYWLDGKFGLLPWLTLAGAVLGAVSAMTLVVREVYRMDGTPRGKSGGNGNRT